MSQSTIYAEVAVNAAVNQTFHYHVPEELAPVWPGHLVRVAFGTAMQPGIVVAIHLQLPPELEGIQTKPIIELLDPLPVMTLEHIALGLWMSEVYLAPPGDCLWLMLPPGITGRSQRKVHLIDPDATGSTEAESAVLDALREESPISTAALLKRVQVKKLNPLLRALAKAGAVRIESVLAAPSVGQKTVRTVERAIPPEAVVDALNKLRRAPKQSRVFAYIAKVDAPLDVTDVYEAVDASSADLNQLERKGLVRLGERIAYRDSLADRDFVPSQPLDLTPEQQQVWEVIRGSLQDNPTPKPPPRMQGGGFSVEFGDVIPPLGSGEVARQRRRGFLLHGVTGSGKTEIYLHAIAETLAQGRQAIFLVPEIALTPQTIRRVAQRFPGQVALVHGSLSQGERFDTWQRARKGEVGVIVGTRSALFTPLPNIGLIVLDEEHDHSYKHAPPFNPPYYHARAVAERIANLQSATVILGSATPDLETYYRAQRGDLQYLHLPSRIMGHRQRVQTQARRRGVVTAYQPAEGDAMTIDLPPVQVVDMREELKAGNRSMFSGALRDSMQEVLERGEQAILFLNRRGQATYVFCRDCGYVAGCPRCDTPLTYHRQGEALRCHHCGHQSPPPRVCPECGSERIRYFGAGTQQVESAVREAFPGAKIVRWDADTASKPELHEQILARFISGEADVMIGTQMVAKGLDLPLVTLVGVVSADPGLALPDFRAQERAFQLLTQVAGRAGRGILGGKVIVQTYQPKHPSIVAASAHDYDAFYTEEIAARRELGYPPFRRMARILVQHTHPVEAQRQVEDAAAQLRYRIEHENLTDTHLIGPAPAFFSRIDRHYRWQILIRSSDPLAALRGVQNRPGWYLDIDPLDVL